MVVVQSDHCAFISLVYSLTQNEAAWPHNQIGPACSRMFKWLVLFNLFPVNTDWISLVCLLLIHAIATVFQVYLHGDMMYEMRSKPEPTLLQTQSIFKFPNHISSVWEELAFGGTLSYMQRGEMDCSTAKCYGRNRIYIMSQRSPTLCLNQLSYQPHTP